MLVPNGLAMKRGKTAACFFVPGQKSFERKAHVSTVTDCHILLAVVRGWFLLILVKYSILPQHIINIFNVFFLIT